MVLLWGADAREQAGFPASFDVSSNSDFVKFLFLCENVVMRGKSEEDKAAGPLCYLQQEAFNLYYSSYSK